MLSQLLNPAQSSRVQHSETFSTSSAASTPSSDNTAAASAASANHSSASASQSQSPAQMAGATMALPPVGVTMQNQDDQRPDLPRPYKCPLCDKAFHRLEHQTRHIRTHTGEKPHACQFPGCTKRFSRSDELTRHSRIHNNPNSRRGNKQHVVNAAAAQLQAGMYDNPAALQQLSQINQLQQLNHLSHINQMNHLNQMSHLSQPQISSVSQPVPTPANHMMPPPQQHHQSPPTFPTPTAASTPASSHSAPVSQLTSPNVSPPHSYATYTTTPGSYMTRNISGELSPTASSSYTHRPMDINMLATAASQVERENSSVPSQLLNLPTRHVSYHHPYHTGRMPSLSSYHYSSNPTSQPMSRSHSHDDDDHRPAKKSRPGSPQSTAPPSPSFSHASASPTPDHTPLATPSHSPRLRPQFFHNGVQLPTLHHLSLAHQPPPALAPVEPSADGSHPYVPAQHSGLRISEIMEAGDGAQRKLPVPIVAGPKDSGYQVRELRNPDSGMSSGASSARASEAGNDLHERF